MTDSQQIGNLGEQIAVNYLLGLNYSIRERNYRAGHLEIDIIAERGGTLYFVEVKTRSCWAGSANDFMPENAMTSAKTQRITRAAQKYMTQYNHTGEVFLELIAINISPDDHQIRHYSAIQWK